TCRCRASFPTQRASDLEPGGGGAGEEGSPRDHLKPPIVMPRMKYRWKTKNRTSRGRITRNEAAISRLKETSCALTERNACRPIRSEEHTSELQSRFDLV